LEAAKEAERNIDMIMVVSCCVVHTFSEHIESRGSEIGHMNHLRIDWDSEVKINWRGWEVRIEGLIHRKTLIWGINGHCRHHWVREQHRVQRLLQEH
jgi:hypothetical protein